MNRVIPTMAMLGCALLLAACGGSGNPSPALTTNGASSGIKFADCMRAHGIPNFPDPSSGGGIQIPVNSAINPLSPAFRAAQSACASLLPGGGPGRGRSSEARKIELVRLAECMRAHGITSFPDPTTTPPSAPPSGGGLAFGGPGGFISVPRTMLRSPGFKTAARECGFPGFGGGGGPKPSAAAG